MAQATSPVDYSVNPIPQLSAAVDQLGKLNAKIAKLQAEADIYKAALKASGLDEVAGTKYKAVISTTASNRLDAEKVRSILTVAQIIAVSGVVKSTRVTLYDL